jgi:hypothetical protein
MQDFKSFSEKLKNLSEDNFEEIAKQAKTLFMRLISAREKFSRN